MKFHCFTDPKIVNEFIRELVLRQMIFGEISNLPGKRWMLEKPYYTEIHHGIRKINVTETQLGSELIYYLTDTPTNEYVSNCVRFLNKYSDKQYLFPIWVPGSYISPYSFFRKVEQRGSLRCTAQRDLGRLLVKQFDEDSFETSFKTILEAQNSVSGAWVEAKFSEDECAFSTANATLLIYSVWKDSRQNNEYGRLLQEKFGDILHLVRLSWINGVTWFYKKLDDDSMLKFMHRPLFTTASMFLTLYPLIYLHDKELRPEKRTLDKAIDFLLRKDTEGIWHDQLRTEERDLETTLRVLALVTQHLEADSLKYHAVRKGLEYLFRIADFNELNSSDLIYWIRILTNINGKDKIQEAIFNQHGHRALFLRRPQTSAESAKLYKQNEEWLLHSRKRRRMLLQGVENQLPHYSKILEDENYHAKQVRNDLH